MMMMMRMMMTTGHNTAGNVRSLVANHVTELKKLLTFGLLRNSEIKIQPIGNQESGGNFK
jgi:Fe2+ transport system protein FeoA